MFRRAFTIVVAGAAAATSLIGTAGQASAATLPNPATGLMALRSGDLPAATQLGRYDVMVLGQPSEWAQIPALKAADPSLKVYIYKDVQATTTNEVVGGVDQTPLTTGVGYAEAAASHPEWFLQDTTGARVPFDDYAGDWWMDVASPSYQAAWAANVAADVHRYGADGVMMDDVNAALGFHLASGTTLAKYPTDASWAAATQSFLESVVPALHASGVQAIANISEPWSTNWEPLWQRWVGDVDGVMYEYWSKYGHDSSYARLGDAGWGWQMQQADDVESAGKIFLPVTYGDINDTTSQTYARASFLLTWNGGQAGQIWSPTSTNTDPWQPAWTASVGTPTGARTQLASGVWQRQFTAGQVLVNPSTTATVTVPLGATFTEPDGTAVSAVTLGPTQAAVLQSAADPSTASTLLAARGGAASPVPATSASAQSTVASIAYPPGAATVLTVEGTDHAVWMARGSGGGWHDLGGVTTAAPAVVSIPNGSGSSELAFFAISSNRRVYVRTLNQGWTQFVGAGACLDAPGAVVTDAAAFGSVPSWSDGQAVVVSCESTNHLLYYAVAPVPANGSAPHAGGWTRLGGRQVDSGPAIASVDGRVSFFADGTDGRVDTLTLGAGSHWQTLPWTCFGRPAVATVASTTTFFCRTHGGNALVAEGSPAGWTGPRLLAARLTGAVGLAADAAGRTFYVQGPNGLYSRSGTTGWIRLDRAVLNGAGAVGT
ncbi:MAG TPA: putative glycoside hydrolase [Mycobacteriales bacterium]|nr:putative glycoside hydrolase [Mycobacteriales bacterium]